jgi:hypothetical protein
MFLNQKVLTVDEFENNPFKSLFNLVILLAISEPIVKLVKLPNIGELFCILSV